MRKLVLSLCVAALGLLTMANVAFAADGSGMASDQLTVRATDIVSGGQGVEIKRWANELVDRWGRTYGWWPSKKITLSLYGSGFDMANEYAMYRGTALTDAERRSVTNFEDAFTAMDMRAASAGGSGGPVILVNLSSGQFGTGVGAANWMNELKGAIIMEMANLMMTDISGSGGPTWMRVGMINYLAQSEVPVLNVISVRRGVVKSMMNLPTAPGLVALHNNWNGVIAMSTMHPDFSMGIATMTVQYMVQKWGPMAIFNMLKQTSGGGTFETLFQNQTGMTIQQMDMAYRSVL